MTDAPRPTVVSTFSGCGGSSLGYQLAGFDVRLAVEWNENAAATYRENFPGTPLHQGDVAKLSVDDALALSGVRAGELDVFDGSPPCQGFSTAGSRSMADPRSQLFREYCRLLRGLRPRAFVFENVKGLVLGKMRVIYAEILDTLKGCGYQVKGALLCAMHYGVAQRRERLVILGARDDLGKLPTFPAPQTDPTNAGDACPSLREGAADPSDVTPEDYLRGGALVLWNKKPLGRFHHPRRFMIAGGKAQDCLKINPDRPAPTIVSSSQGWAAPCHPRKPRALSASEMAQLSGFPADFRFIGSRADAQARIGNSVAPPFMRAIAEHVRATILA